MGFLSPTNGLSITRAEKLHHIENDETFSLMKNKFLLDLASEGYWSSSFYYNGRNASKDLLKMTIFEVVFHFEGAETSEHKNLF